MSEDNPTSSKICGICNEKESKYCCPKCEVLYCSLDCYRSKDHVKCSESFYRDCVNEELTLHNADDESKKKMMDILQRMQGEDIDDSVIEELLETIETNGTVDSDDEEGIDLHERVKNLNLDDPDQLWGALTEDERNEFKAMLDQGDVGDLLPHWDPWWMFRKEEKMIEDVNSFSNAEEEALKKCPSLKEVPKLSDLTKVQPSPAIKFNIVNVLASYAFIMRYFNGETEPVEGTICLLNICGNLDANNNYEDPATAVEAVAQKCLQSELIQTDKLSLDVMKHDTYLILQGPSKENKQHYVLAALSDLLTILTDAKNMKKIKPKKSKSEFNKKFPDHGDAHLSNLDASKVKKSIKKVEYYLSYAESYGMDIE